MAQLFPANRIEVFNVTTAAGTSSSSPHETDTSWQPGILVRLEVRIPAGHAGLTGIMFAVAHGQVIPATFGTFITGNDSELGWDLTGQLDSGAWSTFTYNTDVFDHTHEVRYFVLDEHLLEQAPPIVAQPTPVLV